MKVTKNTYCETQKYISGYDVNSGQQKHVTDVNKVAILTKLYRHQVSYDGTSFSIRKAAHWLPLLAKKQYRFLFCLLFYSELEKAEVLNIYIFLLLQKTGSTSKHLIIDISKIYPQLYVICILLWHCRWGT